MKEGWEYKKLGDVCKTYSGGTPLKNIKEYYENGKIPWLRSGEVCQKYISGTEMFITQKGMENSSAKYYPENTVVVAMYGATAAQVGILKLKATSNQAVCGILPNNEFNPEFLYYFFLYRKDFLASQAQGGAQPNISQVKIKNLLVPVVSLSEQQSIVDYLDSAFAKIDAMKANAEKALGEAKALFQATLKDLLEPKEGWEEKKLGEICEIIRGKRFVRTDIIDEGVPCIHYGDIYTYYGLSTVKTKGCISTELAKKMRFASKNDVVVVQAGENNWDIGVGVAYFGEEPAAVHDACFILKHAQNPMFLSYYFRSDSYHRYLVDYVHEGKICSFLKPALINAPISLPSLDEQKSIVATLDSVKSNVDQLQANFDKITEECDALKQAILKQVFE